MFLALTALVDEPRHGYGIVQEVDRLSEGRVQLKIYIVGDLLAFEVRDWGRFGVSWPEQDSMQERGRGLAMMASLVDEVDLKPSEDCTVVRLYVKAA